MTTTTDLRIRLKKDGRVLSYATCGDPGGTPILHFHGIPSSRYELLSPVLDQTAARLGVRLVLPDRPGFGQSDFQPNRTVLDWPVDVLELADALGLERFAVMGFSGGAPYAAACAYQIPERLSSVGIVSGVGPLERPEDDQDLGATDRQLCGFARRAPWLLRILFWYMTFAVRRNPRQIIHELVAELSEPDKAVLNQTDILEAGMRMVAGAFERGGRGCAWEYEMTVRPWGFRLEDIRIPVLLWHGAMDQMCSLRMGQKMASRIPNANLMTFEQEGHLSLINHQFEAILCAMLGK